MMYAQRRNIGKERKIEANCARVGVNARKVNNCARAPRAE